MPFFVLLDPGRFWLTMIPQRLGENSARRLCLLNELDVSSYRHRTACDVLNFHLRFWGSVLLIWNIPSSFLSRLRPTPMFVSALPSFYCSVRGPSLGLNPMQLLASHGTALYNPEKKSFRDVSAIKVHFGPLTFWGTGMYVNTGRCEPAWSPGPFRLHRSFPRACCGLVLECPSNFNSNFEASDDICCFLLLRQHKLGAPELLVRSLAPTTIRRRCCNLEHWISAITV